MTGPALQLVLWPILEGVDLDWDLTDALTSAAFAPSTEVTVTGGLDWLGRVTRRYRSMFGEPILACIEAMIEVFQGN